MRQSASPLEFYILLTVRLNLAANQSASAAGTCRVLVRPPRPRYSLPRPAVISQVPENDK
jgi:hypothetical protein